MAVKPSQPLYNEHQQVRQYPSSLTTDVLFYEARNVSLPKNEPPVYGTPHPNKADWPHHVLVFIEPRDEKGLQKWWYAADRANQDLYNWEWTDADLGGQKFKAVARTYVIRRDDFNAEEPTMGTVMDDIPEGVFVDQYLLSSREEKDAGDQIRSMYVVERRVFIKRVTIQDVAMDPRTGVPSRIVTTLYYRGETIDGTPVEELAANPSSAYWAIGADGYSKEIKQISENWFSVTESRAVSPVPEFTSESSRLAPERFFLPQQTSTFVTKTIGAHITTAALAQPQERVVINSVGNVSEIRDTWQGGQPLPLHGTTLDERTGETFLSTVETVPASVVAPLGPVDADGFVTTFAPGDASWALKERRSVVSPTSVEWVDIINYEWPPVLLQIWWDVWNAKAGRGSVVIPQVEYKEGFTGPQVVQVKQYWSKIPVAVIPPITMIPQGFTFRCPLFGLSVKPCLHPAIPIVVSTSPDDPEWEYTAVSRTFAPTNYVDWPNEIFWRESKPYRGGFLITEHTLNKPS